MRIATGEAYARRRPATDPSDGPRQVAPGPAALVATGRPDHTRPMRRAAVALLLSAALATGVLIWALLPISDPLGRSCGGGVFSSSVPRPNDDSYLDVCNGLRRQRRDQLATPAPLAGLLLLGSLAWAGALVVRRRDPFAAP
jgi:hypothetical protein